MQDGAMYSDCGAMVLCGMQDGAMYIDCGAMAKIWP